MNPLDAPPADRSVRDRLEGLNAIEGILVGAALSVPAWAIIFGFLIAVHAVAAAAVGR